MKKLTKHIRRLIAEPPLFMTPAMRCACCHLVRGCKGCCRTCKTECNQAHDCELEIARETRDDSVDWWVSCTQVFADWCWECVPDNIMRQLDKQK